MMSWRHSVALCALLVLSIHLLSRESELNRLDAVHSRSPLDEKRKKFQHLVLGPASGQGLPDRLQCSGSRALNKTHSLPSSSAVTAAGDGIVVVSMFTLYNSTALDESGAVMVGNVLYSKTQRAMAILKAFISFVKVAMPQSHVFILTDPASDLLLQRDDVTVHPIHGEYARDKLMLQRIKSYVAFLQTRLEQLDMDPEHTQNYIFTDSDIAIVGDLGSIFQENSDFDVALTFRNNKNQPLNSGFIAVRGTRDSISRGQAFLQEVLEAYSSKFMKASRMLGDQLSLAWVVNSRHNFDSTRFSKPHAFADNLGKTKVLFLPCLTYNWTPPEGAGQFHGMPLDVKVVHFKGSRKRLMIESWNFFNSSFDLDDMLCLILKSGRTKYDF